MKKIIIFFAFIILTFNLSAQVVSYDDAKKAAISFFQATNKTPLGLKSAAVIKVDTFATYYIPRSNQFKSTSQSKEPAFYIFNRNDTPGFAIISADKRAKEVIAYSSSSNFVNTNPALDDLLGQYVNEISYVKENNINCNGPSLLSILTYQNLIQLNNNTSNSISANLSSDNFCWPWLLGRIKWAQDPSPYNSKCPEDSRSKNGRVPAGCDATAMAQILYYYKYPRHGKLSNIDESKYGDLYADFEKSEYRYEMMLDDPLPYSTNDDIALLLSDCGIAVNMDYDYSAGGSDINKVKYAFENYFNFKKCNHVTFATTFYSWGHSMIEWTRLIKNEIDNGRPIFYIAKDNSLGAHAFILDGYDILSDTYHFNWGWGGESKHFLFNFFIKSNIKC